MEYVKYGETILGAVQLLRNAVGGEGGGHGVTLCDRRRGGRPSVT